MSDHICSDPDFCPWRNADPEPAPDLTTLEREVVEAVMGWRSAKLNAFPGFAGSFEGRSVFTWEHDVMAATDALNAARKPKGVKPSEVAPGTEFRFVEESHCRPNTGRVVDVAIDDPVCSDFRRGWVGGDYNWNVYCFGPDDLIIPLNPQEPA